MTRNKLLLSALAILLVAASCAPKETAPPPEITIDTGNLPDAERSLRAKIAREPKNADAHIALGEVLVLRERIAEGIVHFDLATQINRGRSGKVLETRQRLAQDLATQGRNLYEGGDLGAASRALTLADQLDPNDATASILRGEIAQAQGHPEEAIIHFRKARQRSGSREVETFLQEALVSSARQEVEAGRHEAALLYLNEAQEMTSSSELDYLIGTVAYSWAKTLDPIEAPAKLREASEAFERVVKANPEDQDAAYNLGAVLLAQERYSEAVDLYTGLIKRHPKDGELYQALSLAHGRLEMGSLALAENAAGTALRADEPVTDPLEWALRSARRFPGSDLETAWRDMGPPNEVYTFQNPGGTLTELWCYWSKGSLVAFREGGKLGDTIRLP